MNITSKILNPWRQYVPDATIFYCLLPSAAIVLPSTTSSQVNSGDRFPMKGALLGSVHCSPGFHVRGKVGFRAQGWGRDKHLMEGRDNISIT